MRETWDTWCRFYELPLHIFLSRLSLLFLCSRESLLAQVLGQVAGYISPPPPPLCGPRPCSGSRRQVPYFWGGIRRLRGGARRRRDNLNIGRNAPPPPPPLFLVKTSFPGVLLTTPGLERVARVCVAPVVDPVRRAQTRIRYVYFRRTGRYSPRVQVTPKPGTARERPREHTHLAVAFSYHCPPARGARRFRVPSCTTRYVHPRSDGRTLVLISATLSTTADDSKRRCKAELGSSFILFSPNKILRISHK